MAPLNSPQAKLNTLRQLALNVKMAGKVHVFLLVSFVIIGSILVHETEAFLAGLNQLEGKRAFAKYRDENEGRQAGFRAARRGKT